MGGGKRLRPAFCFWGYLAAGGDPDDARVIDAGAAFEMLQAFALVHDDVMDGSATRRGARTAHLAYGDRHVDAGWRGEPRRFGEGVAILIGDLAHVYADQLLSRRVPVGAGGVGRAAHRAQRRPVPRHPRHRPGATPTTRAPAASLATSRASTRSSGRSTSAPPWPAASTTCSRRCRPTATRSARRSSSATTCSAPSARRRPPASRSATTSARASPPRCSPWPPPRPTPPRPRCSDEIGRDDLSADGDRRASRRCFVDTGAVADHRGQIDALTDEAIAAIKTAEIPAEARGALVDLAHFVAWREA